MTAPSRLDKDTILEMSNGHKVIIEKLIGDGLTAEVYRAHRLSDDSQTPVAVKYARLGQNDAIEDEADVLEKMRNVYRLRSQIELTTPDYHGKGKHNGSSFVVMEFLPSKTAPEMISEGIRFTEAQALDIAQQMFVFLDTLHTNDDLKRTYPDFKFEDIRMDGTPETGYRLRLLDLGGLDKIREGDDRETKKDVLTLGMYAFALLSTQTFRVVGGNLTEEAEPVLDSADFKKEVSWGTRMLFRHLLCRVPKYRYTTARMALDEIEKIASYWKDSDEALITKGVEYLDKCRKAASMEEKNQNAAEARICMDVFVRRFGEHTTNAEKKLKDAEDEYDATSFLNKGKADLHNKIFDVAIQSFVKGEAFEARPATFRRWRYLAETLRQNESQDLYAWAEEISKLFEEKSYNAILTQLDQAKEIAGVERLRPETLIYQGYQNAFQAKSDGRYKEAILEFEQLQELLEKISAGDRKQIEKSEGAPGELVLECRTIQEQKDAEVHYREIFEKVKTDILAAKEPTEDIRRMVVAGRSLPVLATDAAGLLQDVLRQGDLGRGVRLLDALYWPVPHKSEPLQKLYHLISMLSDCEEAIVNQRPDRVQTDLTYLVNAEGVQPLIGDYLLRFFRSLIKPEFTPGELDFWMEISRLAQGYARTASENEKAKGSAARKSTDGPHARQEIITGLQRKIENIKKARLASLEDLLERIGLLLLVPHPGKLQKEKLVTTLQQFTLPDAQKLFTDHQSRLEQAGEYLKQASDMNGPLGDPGIQKRIGAFQKELTYQTRVNDLARAWQKDQGKNPADSKDLRTRWNGLKKGPVPMDLAAVSTLLEDCVEAVGSSEQPSPEIGLIVSDCMEMMEKGGLQQWLALQSKQSSRQEQSIQKLKEIQEAYQQGDLQTASAAMASLPAEIKVTPAGVDMQVRLLQAAEFESWAQFNQNNIKFTGANADLLNKIDDYSGLHIPPALFTKYGVETYLTRLKKTDLLQKLGFGTASKKPSFNDRVNNVLTWKWLPVPVSLLLVGSFAAIFVLANMIWHFIPASPVSTETATMEAATVIPMTDTPAATLTPTPTSTATPLPESGYAYQLTPDDPALPVKAETIWQLPVFAACADGSEGYYCAEMDVPVAAGKYTLFLYNDTGKFKASKPPLSFAISIKNGPGGAPVDLQPEIGPGTVQLGTSDTLTRLSAPLPKTWILVGGYGLTEAGTISVKVGPVPTSAGDIALLIEKLLLVKTDETQMTGIPPLENSTLVEILGGGDLLPKYPADRKVIDHSPLEAAWSGNLTHLAKGAFLSPGVLPSGTYLVCFDTRPGETAFDYKLDIISGSPILKSINVGGSALTSGTEIKWNCLSDSLVTLDKPTQLVFVFSSATGAAEGIPIDAVLVYRQDQ